jgi:tartrate-resistant acid phosphatase type 5
MSNETFAPAVSKRPFAPALCAWLAAAAWLASLTAPVAAAGAPPAAGGLNFLVISDWGGKGGPLQLAVAEQMGRAAKSRGSQFVVSCGDNYHAFGIESADSPRWRSEFEDIYQSPALKVPWYASLGNHDNRGNAEAEVQYSKQSARWKMPARYYAHTEKIEGTNEVLFVHLDTSPFVTAYRKPGSTYKVLDQDPSAQLRWLRTTLAASRAPWKIVVGHHPIYSAAPAHGDTKELVRDVLPLLQQYHVQLYFCGHDHVLQHLVHEPINFFVCGGGSSHRNTNRRDDVRFGADSAGFLSVTLWADAADAAFISDQGKELYTVNIPRH